MAGKKFRYKERREAPSAKSAVLTSYIDPAGNEWEIRDGESVKVNHDKRVLTVPPNDRAAMLRGMAQIKFGSPNIPSGVDKKLFTELDHARVSHRAARMRDFPHEHWADEDLDALKQMVDEQPLEAEMMLAESTKDVNAMLGVLATDTSHRAEANYRHAVHRMWKEAKATTWAMANDPSVDFDRLDYSTYLGKLAEWNNQATDAGEAVGSLIRDHCDDPKATSVATRFLERFDLDFPPVPQPGQGGGDGGQDDKSFEEMIEDAVLDNGPEEDEGGNAVAEAMAEAMAEEAGEETDAGEAPGHGVVEGLDDIMERFGNTGGHDVADEDIEFTGAYDPAHWAENINWDFPSLNRNTLLKKTKRTSKKSDEGVIPKNIHRLTTDKRIFNRKRKEMGGSLLIDDSGSMSFSADQLDRLIELAPYAEVRVYSGAGGVGHIKRVAKNGRRCDDLETHYGANECDGPGLDWLSKQPEPRVWVSDGYAYSSNYEHAIAEAGAMCKKGRILRLPNFREAVEFFEGIR